MWNVSVRFFRALSKDQSKARLVASLTNMDWGTLGSIRSREGLYSTLIILRWMA
jgi:hypothetical protein